MSKINPERHLINLKQLLEIIPVSSRTIDLMEARGEFPSRIVISKRRVFWDLNEIYSWLNSRRIEQAKSKASHRRWDTKSPTHAVKNYK